MSDANGKPILTIKGIKGVAIPVVDEERAKHFYGEMLGLSVADWEKEPGGRVGVPRERCRDARPRDQRRPRPLRELS